MIKIENVVLASPEQMEFIIEGMRNPMNSWEKSDSHIDSDLYSLDNIEIGSNDLSLMQRLSNAGTEHRKYMRMMPVYVRITAPLYWWKEFDTYKVGTVANSCSTMHKIAEKKFNWGDFSNEHLTHTDSRRMDENEDAMNALQVVINALNYNRNKYLETKNKTFWWQMIQLLPSSYNQTRNVMFNYEVLANIYRQRKNHKLDEWREFCKWIETLPYSELIIGEKKPFSALSPMLEPGYAYAQNECVNPDVSQIAKDALAGMTGMPKDTDHDTLMKKAIFGNPMRQGGKYGKNS